MIFFRVLLKDIPQFFPSPLPFKSRKPNCRNLFPLLREQVLQIELLCFEEGIVLALVEGDEVVNSSKEFANKILFYFGGN